MTKKKSTLTVDTDLTDLFAEDGAITPRGKSEGRTVVQALNTILGQMRATGKRPRTLEDYDYYVTKFAESSGAVYLSDISAGMIYDWLASMDVSDQTKLTRLKCLKAFLGRCFNNGWIDAKFWTDINVSVDEPAKRGATEKDILMLLRLLDLSRFVELRDAAAVMTMYQTGIRLNTITQLTEDNIDVPSKLLRIGGNLTKNHRQALLPFDDRLARILTALLKQNAMIRREHGVRNNYVFITSQGGKIATSKSHNNIQKRLNKYAKEYGLENINPHAIRRGFAKRLLDSGADIATISRALGHSDLGVTSRYLHLDKEEVADNLRRFL